MNNHYFIKSDADIQDLAEERRAIIAMADDQWLDDPLPSEAELAAREAEYFEAPEDRYYPSPSQPRTNMSNQRTAGARAASNKKPLKLFKEGSRVIYPSLNQIPGTVRHVGSNGVTVKWDDGELTVDWPENLEAA